MEWCCDRCTFLNPPILVSCSMCGHSPHTLDNRTIDLTDKYGNGDHTFPSSPLPWQPVYHFKSPQLKATSPIIDQSDHLNLADIISCDVKSVVLINFVVDITFIAEQCPALHNSEVNVLLLHGSKGNTEAINQTRRDLGLWHWVVSEVSLGGERFGTHHSKIILAFYSSGVRVSVMTANLTETDIHFLTQGIFVQDFPFFEVKQICTEEAPRAQASGEDNGPASTPQRSEDAVRTELQASSTQEVECFMFRTPLLQYLAHVKGAISHAAGIVLNQRMAQLQRVDFSHCKAALVPSRPGRVQEQRERWGALRLASVLERHAACSEDDALVMQCSSLGSMGKGEQFINELARCMASSASCSCDSRSVPSVSIVWPSVECISQSFLGYGSGGSIPCNAGTIEEVSPDGHTRCLKKGFRDTLRKRDATGTCRHLFPAHMKCYFRHTVVDATLQTHKHRSNQQMEDVQLHWFLLTSANLSQAAWGKQERGGQVLYMKSYEMGVLFLPSWLDRLQQQHGVGAREKPFSCTPSHSVLGKFVDPKKSLTRNHELGRSELCKKRKYGDAGGGGDETASSPRCIFIPSSTQPSNSSSNAPSTSSTAPLSFSIPFAIPADKFSFEGSDYPWTWDKRRTVPDSNGNTWPA